MWGEEVEKLLSEHIFHRPLTGYDLEHIDEIETEELKELARLIAPQVEENRRQLKLMTTRSKRRVP